jgi:AcrR family transcriptional regulator
LERKGEDLPQLRLEQGWSVDVGAPWSSEAKPKGLGRRRGKLKPGPGASASEVAMHQLNRIHDAMLELVAERGYGAVTVRDIARRAGVSTRSFYQHCSGKEECFLAVHDRIAARILRALRTSDQEPGGDEQKMMRAIETISRELDRDPRAAHALLLDVYEAGPTAIDRSHQMTRSIESTIGEGEATTLVAQGVLAGLTSVAQARLLSGQAFCMSDMARRLVRWALAYFGGSMVDLEELSRPSASELQGYWGETLSSPVEMRRSISGGNRSLLVSAAERLIKTTGHDEIAVKKLRSVAGVSRRAFEVHFSSLEDCLTQILWQHFEAALVRAREACREGLSPAGGIYRGVVTLCRELTQDVVLRRLCFEGEGFGAALSPRSQQKLKTEISRLVIECVAPSYDLEEWNVDASVGALWGVTQEEVRRGGPGSLLRMAAPLTYLILAPTIGPEQTIAAMRSELDHTMQTHNSQPGRKSPHAGKQIVAQAETAPTR